MLRMVLIYHFLFLPSIKAECFTYTCEDLDEGLCAVVDGLGTISLNENGCPDSICKRLTVETAAVNNEGSVSCEPGGPLEDPAFNSELVDCPSFSSGDNLESGTHPKECATEEDCKLLGGGYSDCVCGMNGLKYCQPEQGSIVFKEYTQECEENAYKISQRSLAVWTFKYHTYVAQMTGPICMGDILEGFGPRTDSGSFLETEEESETSFWDFGVSLCALGFLSLLF